MIDLLRHEIVPVYDCLFSRYLFRFLFSLATDNNGPRVLKNVTVEDKARESRREAMIQAAEARERAWGKKVARASVARRRKVHLLTSKIIVLSG